MLLLDSLKKGTNMPTLQYNDECLVLRVKSGVHLTSVQFNALESCKLTKKLKVCSPACSPIDFF